MKSDSNDHSNAEITDITEIAAIAPGRVNIIGDHTDYTGGLCLPMAINLATTITGVSGGEVVRLTSDDEPEPAVVPLDIVDPTSVKPFWARYVAGVVAAIRPSTGFVGHVQTTIPIGAGLSSSAAFEVALALALGFEGTPLALAQICQRAEQIASGVPCGILDQLSSAAGRDGHAMIFDCNSLHVEYVPMPSDVEVVVIHSGQDRQLAGSGYAERVDQCAAAEAIIGPLRFAKPADTDRIADETIRNRAVHVITENQRVRDFADAMRNRDYHLAGSIMLQSHQSLRNDYETSTPVVDALVSELMVTPGVYGARITGGGFGGCVVALTQPGALDRGWRVRASQGARLL
jgi:galactokinase